MIFTRHAVTSVPANVLSRQRMHVRAALSAVGAARPTLDSWISAALKAEQQPGGLLTSKPPPAEAPRRPDAAGEPAALAALAAWDGLCVEMIRTLSAELPDD